MAKRDASLAYSGAETGDFDRRSKEFSLTA